MGRLHGLSIGLLSCCAVGSSALAASQDNNVEWDGLYADTTANFVTPVAFNTGDSVTIKLRARSNDLTGALCRIWLNGVNVEKRLAMIKATTGPRFDIWSVSLQVPVGTTQLYYRFEATDGTDTDYYDAGSPSDSWTIRGMSDDYRGDSYNFLLLPGFSTPAWAQQAVFYQVFPDRFNDGDAANNNLFPDDCFWYLDYAPASAKAAQCASYTIPVTPANYTKNCQVHSSWTEAPNGGPCDFFGGDLSGLQSKLDYIKDLNATAVYLNPIFRSVSNHKYDTMDFSQVDPRFGGTTAFDSLVSATRAKGLKLIGDGVFNHESDVGQRYNGWSNYAYDNATASGFDNFSPTCGVWEDGFLKQCSSSYNSWFKMWVGTDTYDVDRDGNKTESAAHTCGWYGFEFMPEIDYKSPANPDSAARTWLYGGSKASDPISAKASIAGSWLSDGAKIAKGMDGWRLDVPDNAGYFNNATSGDCSKTTNDATLWQGFRKAVKTVGSDKYIVGEIWADATTNGGVNWFNAGTFDGVMNYYYFGMPVSCFITGKGVHNDAGECTDAYAPLTNGSPTLIDSLDAHLAQQRRLYPSGAYLASQNLLSSHDTSRFVSRAAGDTTKLVEAMYLQATLPGAPMIYYGDEVGVQGANNELGRATFPWSTFDDPNSTGSKLREVTRSLFCVRRAYPALSTGSFMTLWTHNGDKTYGYGRFDSQDQIAVGINNDSATHTLKLAVSRLDVADGTALIDVLTGVSYTVAAGVLSVSVPGHSGAILVPSSRASLGQACATANRAPTADAGPDQSAIEGDVIALDGSSSSDPDGSSLSYLWTDGGAEVGTTAKVNLGALPAGTYTYVLTVSDGVYQDSDAVQIIVDPKSGGSGCGGTLADSRTVRGFGAFLPFAFVGLVMRSRRR